MEDGTKEWRRDIEEKLGKTTIIPDVATLLDMYEIMRSLNYFCFVEVHEIRGFLNINEIYTHRQYTPEGQSGWDKNTHLYSWQNKPWGKKIAYIFL